ncbi:MAG: DUF3108 domain-containing protein [Ramlibacter sp.]
MTAATGVPWRSLVAITAAVACVHWLALRGLPAPLGWRRGGAPPSMLLRQLPTEPPPAAAATQPQAAQPAAARALPVRPVSSRRPPASANAQPASRSGTSALPERADTRVSLATVPASAIWHYAVSADWRGLRVPGEAVLAWQHEGATYEASLAITAAPRPARVQRSEGELGPEGLLPRRFADRTRGEEATHFDRAQGRIAFSSNRPDAPLQPGAQDRLSVLVQLGALVAADPARFGPGASLVLQVAGTRDADEWLFTVDGIERLALPAGSVQALKLTRAPRREYDARLEVWLGPGQDYAPVRLRLTPPNGDWLELQWSGTDKR